MRAHSYTTPILMTQMMSDTVTQCTNYDGHIGNDQKNASEGLINQENKQTNYVLLHFPQHFASTKALMMECWSVIECESSAFKADHLSGSVAAFTFSTELRPRLALHN